jgi:DNA repair protein RecO (recombination protein O)
MSLVTTPAVVLQTYRYSETSKVVRLATRELGIQSAIAKGVQRPKSRFGAGLEFLSEGEAQLYYRDARELHTLAVFDVTNLRRGLARDVARFAGAAALTQVILKMAPPAPLPGAYGVFTSGLDLLASVPADVVDAAALRALWALVTELGFGPSLYACVRDGTPVGEEGGGRSRSAAPMGACCASAARPPSR